MGSAGFLVASTVTPIVGAQLSGRSSFAGVPTAFYWAGGALATLVWGRLMDPMGRRRTLSLGLLVGVLGASLASFFVVRHSFPGFVLGLPAVFLQQTRPNGQGRLARIVAVERPPDVVGANVGNRLHLDKPGVERTDQHASLVAGADHADPQR